VNEAVLLHLLPDGRLVVFHGCERTIFARPIEAGIFLQLLINQLELQAGERPDERTHRHPNAGEAPAPRAA
jgi:hypothetical protein